MKTETSFYRSWWTVLVLCCFCPLMAGQLSSATKTIRWDRQTFSIDGHDVILIGGSMHYFRIPEAEWETDFERMQEDGFNISDVYIPWFIHEQEEGKLDFTNLEKFLDLAEKHGIYIVARPGPYINSESDQGAFPRWLSGKDIGFRRNTDADRKWSKHWYDAIMPVLAKYQVTRGGPVIMVQIENEYGHPLYLSDEEKKEYVRFLYQVASEYQFDVPLMGNDMQFAQKDADDPVLSKIYGTVDAYFDSYQNLEDMLNRQRALNTNSPLGCAEYGLAGAEATVRTMLGLGTDYLDEYLFRGGSQFSYAAKGYEFAGYSADAIVEEGGYTLPKYGAMKTTALFLRHFGATLARAEPAAEPAKVDDPEVWIRQRNNGEQGFLFLRSDVRGVSERTLSLKSASEQHISYLDPKSDQTRTIPVHSRLLLRREQTRLLPLNLRVGDSSLVYSTADLLGRYAYADHSWLVFYGDPGEIGEAAFQFVCRPVTGGGVGQGSGDPEKVGCTHNKPEDLNRSAIWDDQRHEAVVLMPFGDQDQIVPVSKRLSLLLVSRQRAYRAKEFFVGGEPVLLVSSADDATFERSGQKVTFHLQARHSIGRFTLLANTPAARASSSGVPIHLATVSGAQEFSARIPVPSLVLPETKVSLAKSSTGFGASLHRDVTQLGSLPELNIWKKGVTHYHASFPFQDHPLQMHFFTDDYKAVYANGQFAPEASNRATEGFLRNPCAKQTTCVLDIYYVDTGRPKEDLGLWRLDEKKGLASLSWLNGSEQIPIETKWQIEFAGIDDLSHTGQASSPTTTLQYRFSRLPAGELTAVWRAFMPEIRGLVYLNGVYVEHHEPGRAPNIKRDGIYPPPSMLKDQNTLDFVAFEPIPADLASPVIRAEPDSIRKQAQIVLEFAGTKPR